MLSRSECLALLDLETIRGLEFGPADRPWIPQTTPGIRYIDHLSTDELRKKFATSPTYKPEDLCEIHFVNDGRPLTEILGSWVNLDVVAASHVIEHVPNLLQWLRDLASVLRPGGHVFLAAPNKHYEFDRLRRVTNIDDVVADFLEGRTRPSPRAMMDCWMHLCFNGPDATWAGEVDPATLRVERTLPQAYSLVKSVVGASEYRDAHVSVFTPFSFVQLLRGLTELELLPLELVDLDLNGSEFLAVLKSCEESGNIQQRLDKLDETAARLPFVLDDYFSSEYVVRGSRRPTSPAEDKLKQDLESATEELARVTEELERIKGSASWRVTKPLRSLRGRLR